MSPALRPVRAIMDKLNLKPEPPAVAGAGKAGRAELADGEEAAAMTRR
jgi:hypothetical protein